MQRSPVLTGLLAELQRHHPETVKHCSRVARLVVPLGVELGLTPSQLDELRYAARLHDLGKLLVPVALLNETAPLTPEQWQTLRAHPEHGEALIAPTGWKGIAAAARHHHERWDGTGYPDRLQRERIPVLARILAVADAYDAMTEWRTYRRSWLSPRQALREIEAGAGSQFDPDVARVFYRMRWVG